MGWFSAFREDGGPTLYGPNKTAVTADVLEAGLLYAIAILAASFFLVVPGFRGKERIYFLIKIVLGVFITGSIMLCNFGQEWEVAAIHTKTQYRAGTKKEIEAEIEVKIGLRSVNITLKGDPIEQVLDNFTTETVNYNERFHWNSLGWVQGRAGFGPNAGLYNQEFRAAQVKGLPYPILWVAEYFTLDGEGVRWGRHYRQAGYYTHILIWLAFPLWILSMILFKMLVHYGAYFSMLTGSILLLGNILYATIRNPLTLVIPFEDAHLEFTWGWSFWLNLITGFLCFGIGLAVWVLELRFREAIYTFFNVDILQDFEEYYAGVEELKAQGIIVNGGRVPERPPLNQAAEPTQNDDPDYDVYDNMDVIKRMFRRKREATVAWRHLGKAKKSLPRSMSRGADNRAFDGDNTAQTRYRPGRHQDVEMEQRI